MKKLIFRHMIILIIILVPLLQSCKNNQTNKSTSRIESTNLINMQGETIKDRIMTPLSYERSEVKDGSFESYLRNLKLKEYGEKVYYYDGRIKKKNVYVSVLDIDIGKRDLQQCADAIMRLRGEYLYGIGQYDKLHFNFTNGFNARFDKWVEGNRIAVDGNNVSWVNTQNYDNSYESFRKYMNMVFAYAGTLSLSNELERVNNIEDIKIGDVFIQGGSPGHAVIVVDIAINNDGEKLFLLAQSYMPAQSIHVLKNPMNEDISPWYSTEIEEKLYTPEWTFNKNNLMRFNNL